MPEIDPTTRAYTLKLSGAKDVVPSLKTWRELLWTTHYAVNVGVRVWGDWLLTLRGGLPASLGVDSGILPVTDKQIDAEIKRRKLGNEANREIVRRELERQRESGLRVVLALSWLSVETPATLVPKKHIVATGRESRDEREKKIAARFREILNRVGVKNAAEWIADCEPALTAHIRNDAVWVDRSAAFSEFAKQCQNEPTAEWASDTLLDLLGGVDDYFTIPEGDAPPATESKDFVIKAGNWLSKNWGAGEKSDSGAIAKMLAKLAQVPAANIVDTTGVAGLAALLKAVGVDAGSEPDGQKRFKLLKQAVGWKGRPSKGAMALEKLLAPQMVTANVWQQIQSKLREEADEQKTKAKGTTETPAWMADFRAEIERRIGMAFRIQRDNIWEYAVMLDHALRRVSAGHTWIKRAESSRRQFKEDAGKISVVPQPARDWLDSYRRARSKSSGATDDETPIRRGAIDGWDEVVKAWSKLDKGTRQDRIDAARDIQRNLPDDKKFGDIQLFAGFGDEDEELPASCLADDAAWCAWHDAHGKLDATILKDYVAAKIAEHNQSRFKVPAYRHPDPLRHPVFVDFGNSRWSIVYSALKAVQDRGKLLEKLAKAKTDKTRDAVQKQLAEKPDLHGVTLSLWTDEIIEPQALRWHSKRLRKDLDFDHFNEPGASVSRADRLGRAVAGQPRGAVEIAQVFDQSDWSGRLQAPRRELDRLADLIYGRKQDPDERALNKLDGKARKQWDRIKWFLSLSAKLQPSGPWLDYAEKLPDGWEYKKGKTGYYLNVAANDGRKGRARLKLSRLPGLRVLSIDLGHRYAAACAVWEAISSEKMEDACNGADEVIRDDGDTYRHLKHKTKKIAEKTGKPIVATTIYRRVGPDVLPKEKRHPAPWARLDRQFLIRLQGEDHQARRVTSDEFKTVKTLHDWLGIAMEEPRDSFEARVVTEIYPRVDELLLKAVGVVRQGLRRHGDYARIAFALTSQEKPFSGGRSKVLSRDERIEALIDALVIWQNLANATEFSDQFASDLWRTWVNEKFGGPQPVEIAENVTRFERRKMTDKSRGALMAVAEALVDRENSDLHNLWANEWQTRTTEWKIHLRALRRRIMPRIGKRPRRNSPDCKAWKACLKGIRDVGGLSYTRLATIRGLYQVMRAFHSRPEPGDLRAGVKVLEAEAETGFKFGDRMLQALERLRENRIKQLASRIVEAALGIGSENRAHWERGRKRPQQRIEGPRFATCHMVVVEDLENYRPEETRMRRENRQLMAWSARNVRKYIVEACQLNGLYFDEVSPRYTSRQDSRTGQPGARCVDVRVDKFLEPSGFWRKQVDRARQRIKDGKADDRDKLLVALFEKFNGNSDARTTLRIPDRAGEMFVSSVQTSSKVLSVQADLNAAANIGLKAILDPDWTGAWWYVPCNAKGVPLAEKTKGSAVAELDQPLATLTAKGDAKNVVNLWRDPSTEALERGNWLEFQAYWSVAVSRVVAVLEKYNSLDAK